jgi:hypothetical protein
MSVVISSAVNNVRKASLKKGGINGNLPEVQNLREVFLINIVGPNKWM